MEEQNNNSKEIKMQPMGGNKQNTIKQPELTKEQLKDLADRLFSENRMLKHQLQQAQEFINTINRLDYLFRIIEFANGQTKYNFNHAFIEYCFKEIEKTMNPPKEVTVDSREEA